MTEEDKLSYPHPGESLFYSSREDALVKSKHRISQLVIPRILELRPQIFPKEISVSLTSEKPNTTCMFLSSLIPEEAARCMSLLRLEPAGAFGLLVTSGHTCRVGCPTSSVPRPVPGSASPTRSAACRTWLLQESPLLRLQGKSLCVARRAGVEAGFYRRGLWGPLPPVGTGLALPVTSAITQSAPSLV